MLIQNKQHQPGGSKKNLSINTYKDMIVKYSSNTLNSCRTSYAGAEKTIGGTNSVNTKHMKKKLMIKQRVAGKQTVPGTNSSNGSTANTMLFSIKQPAITNSNSH